MIRDELAGVQQGPEQVVQPFRPGGRTVEVRRAPLRLRGGRWAAEGAEERLLHERVGVRVLREPGTDLVQPAVFAAERRQQVLVVPHVYRLEQVRLVRRAAVAVAVPGGPAEDGGCVVAVLVPADEGTAFRTDGSLRDIGR